MNINDVTVSWQDISDTERTALLNKRTFLFSSIQILIQYVHQNNVKLYFELTNKIEKDLGSMFEIIFNDMFLVLTDIKLNGICYSYCLLNHPDELIKDLSIGKNNFVYFSMSTTIKTQITSSMFIQQINSSYLYIHLFHSHVKLQIESLPVSSVYANRR